MLTLSTFFLSSPVFAETVYLKDGSALEGRISAQSKSEITLLTSRGAMHVEKTRISRILFGDDSGVDPKEKFDPAQVDEILKRRAEREKELDRLGSEKVGGALFIEDMKVSRWEYVWRSALLPGWGHIYGRQWKEGIGYSTIFALTAISGVGLYAGALSSEKTYRSSINFYYAGRYSFTATPQDHDLFLGYGVTSIRSREDAYHKNVTRANLAILGLGGVYLWQLAHAYWFGVTEEKKDESLSFHFVPSEDPGGLYLQARNPYGDSPRAPGARGLDHGVDIGLSFPLESNAGSIP